ncbi:hypothetical protein OHT74_38355 [Streptomyces sp. NBC_00354]
MPRLGLGRPRKRPDRVRADKVYDSRSNRPYLCRRGIKATIPVPSDRVRNRLKWRIAWREATEVRQGRLQAAACRRVRDQPPQAPPGRRHQVRQNSPSATKRPCWSQPSTNGCDQHFHTRP